LELESNLQNFSIYDFAGLLSIIDDNLTE
jgi:hypothetical protein